ncbi:MAG: GNAT family N-acetyltransferase [Oscillospiraceae bacterium]|jgi:GNAT superfamily N-acetyltransferase|nr:GNAT family N-acetyltransferase [Oscillospiraceae bacterium]
MEITVQKAARADVPDMLTFINGLAAHVGHPEAVTATAETLEASIFDRQEAQVLIARCGGEAAGWALYFYNYSTFLAKRGIFMEDLFVKPAWRGKGVGRELISALAKIALEEGCARLDWNCLDWNTGSVAFYKGMGAEVLAGESVYRLTGDSLRKAADCAGRQAT